MAKRPTALTDLMNFSSKLPWQASIGLAVVSAAAFHLMAGASSVAPKVTGVAQLGTVVVQQGIHTIAFFLQLIVPAALLIGALVSVVRRARSEGLLLSARTNPTTALAAMSWRDFERLVGEAFRQQGFTVTGFGGQGPDGGVDLGLSKNGERFLVQCKHWRKQQVGVTVVRELNGVIAAQGALGGFVVTGGQFTKEAQVFAASCNIILVDGPALGEMISGTRANRSTQTPTPELASTTHPTCPKCGTPMVQREAKQGKFAGRSFWGCASYPKCTGIRQTG